MYQLIAYIKFLLRSFKLHGVHSPFVYRFAGQCLHDGKKYTNYTKLEKYRQRLMRDRRVIKVTDFGAGSRVFKSDDRTIAKIARNAGITRKRAKLMYRLVQFLEPNNMLELGTSLGMATAAMSLGNRFGKVVTVEGCSATANVARKQFDHLQLENIELLNDEFKNALESDAVRRRTFDLVYVDGHHDGPATWSYFESVLDLINKETLMIFDDIHWSKDMNRAWQEIKDHPDVKVTIDTFYWGLVFFRKEQEKEHFTIRL